MPTVKAPKQAKRKQTPFEKLDKANDAHIIATRKLMAKIRAEIKQLDGDAHLGLMLEYCEESLAKYELSKMALKRGHTIYLLEQKAKPKIESELPDGSYVSEGDRQSWMRV